MKSEEYDKKIILRSVGKLLEEDTYVYVRLTLYKTNYFLNYRDVYSVKIMKPDFLPVSNSYSEA